VTDDAYEILQVHPKADLDVIRAAFRTLARKYHPDFGGTGGRMVSLNEAWHTIGDPKRRKAYDARLAAEAAAGTVGATVGAPVPTMDPRPSPGASWQPAARSGKILDFGRYAGWSIVDLGRHDPIYLEWLGRTPIGRPLRSEIQEVLGLRSAATSSPAAVKERPRRRWGR
jgi:curved DNA-binding protein CbpA